MKMAKINEKTDTESIIDSVRKFAEGERRYDLENRA